MQWQESCAEAPSLILRAVVDYLSQYSPFGLLPTCVFYVNNFIDCILCCCQEVKGPSPTSIILSYRDLFLTTLGQIKLSVLNSTDGSLVRVKNIKILKSEVSFCLSESGMLYRLLPIDNQKAICCCAKPKENWLRIHGWAETVPKKYTTFSIVGNSPLGGDVNVDFCSQIINDFTDPNHYELFLWSLDKINLECNVSVAITKMCRNGSMRNT